MAFLGMFFSLMWVLAHQSVSIVTPAPLFESNGNLSSSDKLSTGNSILEQPGKCSKWHNHGFEINRPLQPTP